MTPDQHDGDPGLSPSPEPYLDADELAYVPDDYDEPPGPTVKQMAYVPSLTGLGGPIFACSISTDIDATAAADAADERDFGEGL